MLQKLAKIHSKPSILTLFNKFLVGFERFKKYQNIDSQLTTYQTVGF